MVDASGWQITASSTDAGWLPVPEVSDLDARRQWIDTARDELRADWGDRWVPEHEALVGAALEHALAQREPDDVLCFQLWPVRLPYAAIVHVGLIAPEKPLDWDEIVGHATPIELDGVGPGIQRTFAVPVPEAEGELVGVDLVCMGEEVGLLVRLEPTMEDMLAVVGPMLLGFADTIAVTAPDGAAFRSLPPIGAVGGEDATWSTGEETA